jgi:hypothetical protein
VAGLLREVLPRRLVDVMRGPWFDDGRLGSLSAASMAELGARLNHWEFRPGGSEGYRTAEVTLGGIDTKAASSKTFEIEALPGLYAIGEALDVTGWLGATTSSGPGLWLVLRPGPVRSGVTGLRRLKRFFGRVYRTFDRLVRSQVSPIFSYLKSIT